MSATPHCHLYAAPPLVALALADRVAEELRQAIGRRGQALIAVSGGSTPVAFFEALSRIDLAWKRVWVALVDERFVAPTSPRSNERLVRRHLLQNRAARARLAGLYAAVDRVEEAAGLADRAYRDLPFPLDVAVLGMGLDGHTASFFPDADRLEKLLDPANADFVLPVHASAAGEPRLTLTLARLVQAGFIALHIEGEDKRERLGAALRNATLGLPVRAIFDASPQPVHVFWAPANQQE